MNNSSSHNHYYHLSSKFQCWTYTFFKHPISQRMWVQPPFCLSTWDLQFNSSMSHLTSLFLATYAYCHLVFIFIHGPVIWSSAWLFQFTVVLYDVGDIWLSSHNLVCRLMKLSCENYVIENHSQDKPLIAWKVLHLQYNPNTLIL